MNMIGKNFLETASTRSQTMDTFNDLKNLQHRKWIKHDSTLLQKLSKNDALSSSKTLKRRLRRSFCDAFLTPSSRMTPASTSLSSTSWPLTTTVSIVSHWWWWSSSTTMVGIFTSWTLTELSFTLERNQHHSTLLVSLMATHNYWQDCVSMIWSL